MNTLVTKTGYLLHFESTKGRRTYVCINLEAVWDLAERLTGRTRDSFAKSELGLPKTHDITINYGVHIYGDVQFTGVATS